jgi:hypothetical protein
MNQTVKLILTVHPKCHAFKSNVKILVWHPTHVKEIKSVLSQNLSQEGE